MEAKIRREKGVTVLEGDGAFFDWLAMAANSAGNGNQGNAVELVGGRLELVTTQPNALQRPAGRKPRVPRPPKVEGA